MDAIEWPPSAPFAHPLTYVRHLRGWSATTLLEVIADSARSHFGIRLSTTDRNKVHRWETRGVVPDVATQRALARALDIPECQLASLAWPAWLPAFDGVRPLRGWSPTRTMQALADALDDGIADRRGYLGLTGPELLAIAREWSEQPPPQLTAVACGPLTAGKAVAAVERQAGLVRWLEPSLAADTIGELASAHLRLASDLLSCGHYEVPVARRLHVAAAALAHLAGWAAYDAGRHFAAQRYYRAALHAATAVHDRTLGAYLLICMGYQTVRCGDVRSGVELASLAVTGTVSDPSRNARSVLTAHRALTLLAAGEDSAAVRAALGGTPSRHRSPTGASPRARGRSSAAAPVDPPWLSWFQPQPAPEETTWPGSRRPTSLGGCRYLLLEDGRRPVRRLGAPLRRPSTGSAASLAVAGTPWQAPASRAAAQQVHRRLIRRTHHQLHRLAQELAESGGSEHQIRELRDRVRALLPPAA